MKWKLTIIDHNGIESGRYNGDRLLNTYIEHFLTLDEVWAFIGGKLKKERCGYAGFKGNTEYILIRA
jgi:hypothetical protein